MNKEVETLKKKDIKSYVDFIKETFEYEPKVESIEKMMKKSKVLVIKDKDKVIASVVVDERTEYIKDKKYYYLSYFGVLKEYRREGHASKLFDKIEEMVKENEISYVELISGNQRRNAHYFYKSKDFRIKDATIFVKLY